ncbi:hypothetical protein BMF94_0514 [Rhodotorula taiwanensis]|uniref:Extracellular membrane protein CFEM domain-containing protein n=1 Tax=Rhodotorula taiwanensis TaxID=741276 RepID=A0A2S5BHQ9_9BASI|nr:hypothetical protein BMF94_0514 [Rhodotorula taiwanensis]
MFRSALAYAGLLLLGASIATVDAQATSSANVPSCATGCFATKIVEAGYLAPNTFAQAYYNCLGYHCIAAEYQQGVILGQAVCASVGGALDASGITGSATQVLATLSSIPVASGSMGASAAAQFSTFLSDISAVVGTVPVTSAFSLPSATSTSGSASTSASQSTTGSGSAAAQAATTGAKTLAPQNVI